MAKALLPLLFFISAFSLHAQTIVVEPFLQHAEPTQMVVVWETNTGGSSEVRYGVTDTLGLVANGASVTGNGTSKIHTVWLGGLQPGTRYYYRVATDSTVSTLYHFQTPALASAEFPTGIVAMSDMQRDGANPTKFSQVINNGVLQYFSDSIPGDLADNLQMVVIPGDLVDNGNDYLQWEQTFFDPGQPLFSYVPVYPVLGNHEANTPSYFKYFTLPDNGTPGYEEHWWYKDHSNVRIIGLNSNGAYQIQAQLNWLDTVLTDAANDPNIDFVFAQLHHPHHSELWIAGNTNYTGEVIERLENFSTATGKPSIHFFGHTHGYSRGQSRDHNHLMVNVATAGGNIDSWGEYAQTDYPEYNISEDTYGWVYVQVEAGENPRFTLKRYSIGDGSVIHPNKLEDLVTIKKNNNQPIKPIAIFPTVLDTVNPNCLILKTNNFIDPDNDGFGAAQWQVAPTCGDFSQPIVDSWKQYENWYFEVDLQAGDDLTDERVTDLTPASNYCWRVRFRDKSLAWSDWSTPSPFVTGTTQETANLLVNTGAEDSTSNWVATAGVIESLTDGQCAGTTPYAGEYYFAVGALCTESAFGSAQQTVDVSAFGTEIDQGIAVAKFGGQLRDYLGTDVPSFAVRFLDNQYDLIADSDTTSYVNGEWTLVQDNWAVPAGTRYVQMIIMGTRTNGLDNDSYFDDLFLKLNFSADSCSQYTPVSTSVTDMERVYEVLQVYPNPMIHTAMVNVPNTEDKHLTSRLVDAEGKTVRTMEHIHGPSFTFSRDGLPAGVYFLVVYMDGNALGYAKVLMQR
ncbi:MAG: fibronectin type III domain-containing protein [Saprospiraceae bacterium]|nr:fibronectin type III domain-containing protein [Saprospiraceae bacterium]